MAVRTIGTDIKLTGEKEFNDGMKAINSNLKNLRSDMAATAATFEDNADSVEALTAKNKILQDSVEQQRVKVSALRAMYESAKQSVGENASATDKYKQQLNFAVVELAKAEKALRQNNEAMEKAKSAASAAEEAVEDLADANTDVARTADRAADELDDMADKAEKTGNILPAVAQGFGSLASGAAQASAAVLAVGAGLGTAAITAMVSFAKESAEAAKAAADAGEPLTDAQQSWLAYADKLDVLDDAAAKAKRAVGGIILPQLSALSTDGADYLNNFAQSLEETAGDTEKQAEVISEYMVKGAELLLDNLPGYIETGKTLLGGLKDGFMEAAPEIWAAAEPLIQEFLAGLGSHGPEVIEGAIGVVSQFITGLASDPESIISGAGDLVGAVVSGITDALPDVGSAAGKIVGEVAAYLLDPDNIAEAAKAAWDMGKALAEAIWNGLEAIFTSIADIPGLLDGLGAAQQYQLTGTIGPAAIPGYADGLNRVPYDNYLARLHKDEMVLTAAEAARYRSGREQTARVGVIENLTIYTQHLDEAEMERILDTINRKLGDDM